MSSLAQQLDWEYIVTITMRHGIASLLYKNIIDRVNKSCVPPIFDSLEKCYQGAAYRNLLFLKEYDDIAHAFSAEQVALLPLKGIDFIRTVYPNIALRTANDIDILIKKAVLGRAKNILRGWAMCKKRPGMRRRRFFIGFFPGRLLLQPCFLSCTGIWIFPNRRSKSG